MTKHIMIDLETLGTKHDAIILSIGAVRFDPLNAQDLTDCFYVPVDPVSCEQYGLKADATTVMWWLGEKQSAARAQMVLEERTDLGSALEGFAMWYGTEPQPVWGNGATFDNVILRTAYERAGLACPWAFFHDRCYRTMKSLTLIPAQRHGMHHNALHDAITQARHLCEIVAHHNIEI